MTPVSQRASNGPTADLPVNLPSALQALMDETANRGAYSGRAGHDFRAFAILALPDATEHTADDLALLAWAGELGWREGLFTSGKAVRP